MQAVEYGWTKPDTHLAVVKLLLDRGADVFVRASDDYTALRLAQVHDKNQIQFEQCIQDATNRQPRDPLVAAMDALKDAGNGDAQAAARERVIRVALSLPNLPPIPDEAKQDFLQARAILQSIRSSQTSTENDLYKPIDLLQKALKLAPWLASAYYNLAVAMETNGQYDDAIKQLGFYLELKPSEADAADARAKIAVLQQEKETAARKKQENEALLAVKYVSGGVTRLRYNDAPKWWSDSSSIDTLYTYAVPEEWPFYVNVFRLPNGHYLAIFLIAQSNNGLYAGDRIGVIDITDKSCLEFNDFAFGEQNSVFTCGTRYYFSVSNQPNATVTITYSATGASVTLPVGLLYRGRAREGRGIFGGCSGKVHQGGARAMVLEFDCSLVEAAKDPTVNAAGLTPTTVKPE